MFHSLKTLADELGGTLRGEDCQITGLATLKDAAPGDLSFLANPSYRKLLAETRASAVLVRETEAESCPCAAIVLDNPYLAYAKVSALFDPYWKSQQGIDPAAHVHPQAQVADSAYVAPGAVIGAGAIVHDGVQIGANSVVAEDVVIGPRTRLAANVTLYPKVSIGSDCVIHSSSVIGADGFGFAPGAGGWTRIHQLGGVRIGNRVEIGACTTIDRGALNDTVIEDGVILDNHIQIAHNVVVGENTAMAGCAAVAGSTEIGPNCLIAGGVGLVGHITVGAGSQVAGRTMVTKSLPEKSNVASGLPMEDVRKWRKTAVRLTQLDSMAQRLKDLELKLAQVLGEQQD